MDRRTFDNLFNNFCGGCQVNPRWKEGYKRHLFRIFQKFDYVTVENIMNKAIEKLAYCSGYLPHIQDMKKLSDDIILQQQQSFFHSLTDKTCPVCKGSGWATMINDEGWSKTVCCGNCSLGEAYHYHTVTGKQRPFHTDLKEEWIVKSLMNN